MEAHIWADPVYRNSPKSLEGQSGGRSPLGSGQKGQGGVVREGNLLPCKYASSWRNKRGRHLMLLVGSSPTMWGRPEKDAPQMPGHGAADSSARRA